MTPVVRLYESWFRTSRIWSGWFLLHRVYIFWNSTFIDFFSLSGTLASQLIHSLRSNGAVISQLHSLTSNVIWQCYKNCSCQDGVLIFRRTFQTRRAVCRFAVQLMVQKVFRRQNTGSQEVLISQSITRTHKINIFKVRSKWAKVFQKSVQNALRLWPFN